VFRDNGSNMDKAMRDTGLKSYGCFAHSLQLVGVLNQKSVSVLLGKSLVEINSCIQQVE